MINTISIASIVSLILVVFGFIVQFIHVLHSAALRLQVNKMNKDVQSLKNATTIGQKINDGEKIIQDGASIASSVGKVIVNDVNNIHL